MKEKMITFFKKFDFSWIFLIFSIVILISVCTDRMAGNEAFILNHRTLFIETGSMEPYIKQYGLVVTRKVTKPSQIEEGDVVSFFVTTNNGNRERILHRIIKIEDDRVYTKGDNNNVADNFDLTTEDILEKEVLVFNWSSWIVHTALSGTKGVIILICSALSIVFFYFAGSLFIKSYLEEKYSTEEEDSLE